MDKRSSQESFVSIAVSHNADYEQQVEKDGSEDNCPDYEVYAHRIVTESAKAQAECDGLKLQKKEEARKSAASLNAMESTLNLLSPGRGVTAPRGVGHLSKKDRKGLMALGKSPTSAKKQSHSKHYCLYLSHKRGLTGSL